MELLQLRYFLTVAKLESITNAANHHNIPQPAMSQTISRLEKDLGGIQLFDRRNGRVYLNENGKLFLNYVEEALMNLDSGIQALKSHNTEISGNVKLLVMENRRFILSCVSRFSELYPKVTFYISHDFYSDQSTTYDLCISSKQAHRQMKKSVPFIRESIVLNVHESNPLAKRKQVRITDLKNEKFITMPSRSSLFNITYNSCRACGFEPTVQFICDDPYFVRKYVSENMGIALALSLSWEGRFRSNTQIVPIVDPPVQSTSFLIWDDRHFSAPAVVEFRRFLIEQANQLPGNLLREELPSSNQHLVL